MEADVAEEVDGTGRRRSGQSHPMKAHLLSHSNCRKEQLQNVEFFLLSEHFVYRNILFDVTIAEMNSKGFNITSSQLLQL
jgi:hypothetical protein